MEAGRQPQQAQQARRGSGEGKELEGGSEEGGSEGSPKGELSYDSL